jgi:DNA helicase-2/ATP-dependent DNA helicase PcrA
MTPKASSSSHESSPKSESPEGHSIDNIARFFGGKDGAIKPGSLLRPAMEIPATSGAVNLKKGQRVRHAKYGEGTILLREGDGEGAKLTILFNSHGVKKLMEKFANLKKM